MAASVPMDEQLFPLYLPEHDPPELYDLSLTDGNAPRPSDGMYDPFLPLNSPPPSVDGNRGRSASGTERASLRGDRLKEHEGSVGLMVQPWTHTPDASSSSSGSIDQHLRNSSMGSSPDLPSATIAQGSPVDVDVEDEEETNRFMESHFDFDSAADSGSSSPGVPLNESTTPANQAQGLSMAFRRSGHGNSNFRYSPGPAQETPEIPASRFMIRSRERTRRSREASPPQAVSPRELDLDRTPNLEPIAVQTEAPPVRSTATITPPQSALQTTFAVGQAFAAVNDEPPPSKTMLRLHISPLPLKSRVETQANIKLTIDPLPENITKLHLQPYTIAKAKFLAKPTPPLRPDTLELYAMLVCTSAMDVERLRTQAFKRAHLEIEPHARRDGRRSSAGDAPGKEYEVDRPLSGGPVSVCLGCVERERKRAARKKIKNPDEDEVWLKEETKRIVVFNTQEVKEWQFPSQLMDPKRGEAKHCNPSATDPTRLGFSPDARQVEIPMRIACYCRHQEEKAGFRVIFTVRNHEKVVIAQAMSSSIMITDDHKTHAPVPHMSTMMPFPEQMPYAQVPLPLPPPNPAMAGTMTRNAFSTTDLQRLNQGLLPPSPHPGQQAYAVPIQAPPALQTNSHSLQPFNLHNNNSVNIQNNSTNITPRNLSRPASPTLLPGQHPKRRKGNSPRGSRPNLTMTPARPNTVRSPVNATTTSDTPMIDEHGLPEAAASSAQQSLHQPVHFPSDVDAASIPTFPRSQSFHTMQPSRDFPPSSDSSAMQSRGVTPPNPASTASRYAHFAQQPPAMTPENAQLIADALSSGDATTDTPAPFIIELTPDQGPTSGGSKVTCLGGNFAPGLHVMFGGALATTTTYWGESTLSCVVPPAVSAGVVPVTLRYGNGQPILSSHPTYYTYIQGDEKELMKHMFAMMGHGPQSADTSDFARYVLAYNSGKNSYNPGASNPNQQSGGHRQAAIGNQVLSTERLETGMLRCLDLLDMDESPRRPNLNYRGSNGQSMLHQCASLGMFRMAAALLARGANADLRDNNGMTPLHMASLRGHVRIIRKLRAAGGDPTLRSLNGFTPAEMAVTVDAQFASGALDIYTRARSAAATPITSLSLSRTASQTSYDSDDTEALAFDAAKFKGGDVFNVPSSMGPTLAGPISRRGSSGKTGMDAVDTLKALETSAYPPAVQSAIQAWRDQLSAQIQQVQQTFNKALPLLPALADYQGSPVVRRISSLVPQRGFTAPNQQGGPTQGKEADYHWWELLTGASSAPPAYEDIYPARSDNKVNDEKLGLFGAAAEAVADEKCQARFDQAAASSEMETINIGSQGVTSEQRERLLAAHARKIKRLRSDRNLFFIWIPLLLFVGILMLKDRVPQVVRGAQQAYNFLSDRLPGRIVEIV